MRTWKLIFTMKQKMKFWDSKDASERNLYNWRSQKHEKKKTGETTYTRKTFI